MRPTRRAALWLSLLAVYGLSVAFSHLGLATHAHGGDLTLYQQDAHAIAHGSLPYRDLYFEYPPGALAPLLAVEPFHDYPYAFKLLMAVLGALLLVAAADVLRSLRFPPWPLFVIAVAPLALGSVFLNRYDVWPALLAVGAIALLARGRPVAGLALVAVGTATKIFPLALAPAALVWTWRRFGRETATRALAALVGVGLAILLPFAALGPGGLSFSFYIQGTRHLETESLFGSILLAADRLGLYRADVHTGKPGSLDLFGTVPTALGALSLLTVVAGVLWLGRAFLDGPDDRARLVCAAAAAVAVYVAFGKVLSPQYLVWLVPLVPLVRGLLVQALLLVALVLTQIEFDDRFHELHSVGPVVWILLARNLVLVALAALLVAQVRGGSQTSKPATLSSR